MVTPVVVVILLCTCIFHSGFWYPNVFNALSVLLLVFLVVLNICTVNKVSFVSFYPILALSCTGFAFFTFYCIFGASGVNSSFCGVGNILAPVSWGVSEICSFFRGTTALVSCVINCARWWSTGPVHILATWCTCSFSGLAFLLEASPLFLWLCWSFTGSGTVFSGH